MVLPPDTAAGSNSFSRAGQRADLCWEPAGRFDVECRRSHSIRRSPHSGRRAVRPGSHQVTATAPIPVLMIFIISIRRSSRFHQIEKTDRPLRSRVMIRGCPWYSAFDEKEIGKTFEGPQSSNENIFGSGSLSSPDEKVMKTWCKQRADAKKFRGRRQQFWRYLPSRCWLRLALSCSLLPLLINRRYHGAKAKKPK